MRKPEEDSSRKDLNKMRFICKCFTVESGQSEILEKDRKLKFSRGCGMERVCPLVMARTRTPYSHSAVHIVGAQKCFLNE